MIKVAIYGTGNMSKNIYQFLQDKVEIIFFIDEYYKGDVYGINVYNLLELTPELINTVDKIYIGIQDFTNRLRAMEKLQKISVPFEKIDFIISNYNLQIEPNIHTQMVKDFILSYLFDSNYDKVIENFNNSQDFDLQSVFAFGNQKALIKVLNKLINQKTFGEELKVLEVGSWKGVSSTIIAKTIQNYQGTLYCVDTWGGSFGVKMHQEEMLKNDILNTFRKNIEYFGLSKVVKIMKMTSLEASEVLKDNQFDLIFIDADHTYDFVNQDIKAFLPKLKKGGIICGDDCEDYYYNLSSQFVDKNKNIDFTKTDDSVKQNLIGGYHCGVIKALHDNFKDEYIIENNSSFWWKEII